MSVVNAISLAAITSGIFAFYSRRSLRYLQFFQQEEYNTQRFFNWWQEKKAFDTRGSLVAIVAAAATFGAAKLNPWLGTIVAVLGSIVLTAIAYSEEDPQKVGKITLKMTERATRIYQLALALYAIKGISVGLALYFRNIAPVWEWLAAIFLIQSTPVWPILANAILWPQEESRQQQYLQEAYQIFQEEDPVTIGITGSYGKT